MKIFEDERIDDLQFKGLKIIQKKKGFCFGIDAVLLANFANVSKDDIVLDLGTGTGIIPILIAGHTQAKKIIGVEIQSPIASMAKRSVAMNNLQDRIDIVNDDLKNIDTYMNHNSFDVVTTNPPYIKSNGGLTNEADTKAISRHEIKCSLEDVVRTAAKLLKHNGQFFMVNRPERLVDIITLMRKYKVEPKLIRLVHPSKSKNANLVLVKGIKGAKHELKVVEPLYVYDQDGNYTKEIDYIYNRGEEE